MPTSAVVSITERCNSKCTFCGIWSVKSPGDLDPALLGKLPPSLREINITGGEPFLHRSFDAVLDALAGRECRIIINTNGLSRLRSFPRLFEIPRTGIRFSLDGGREVHDSLRGIPGNYDRVLGEIRYLRERGFGDIGISATFGDENAGEMADLYGLAAGLGVGFTCMVAGNSEIYYRRKDHLFRRPAELDAGLADLAAKELRSLSPRRWGKAVYIDGLRQLVRGELLSLPCPAAESFFFIQPPGKIYACNMRNLPLGDLREESFETIWRSEAAKRARRIVADCRKPCWTMCNAKAIMAARKGATAGRLLKLMARSVAGRRQGGPPQSSP